MNQAQIQAVVPQEGAQENRSIRMLGQGENTTQSVDFRGAPGHDVPTLPRLPPETPLTSRRDSYGDKLRRRRALTAAVLAVLGATGSQAAEPAGVVDRSRVVVVDGDSVALDGQEWRLQGYDTPEIERAGCEGERRLALAAKRRLSDMVAAALEIRLDGGTERDRYKRPLGDLVLDGVNVREVMISEGWARPYNGGRRKGWCSRDSIDTLVPGDPPAKGRR